MPNTHEVLRKIVEQTRCKPGWKFALVNEEGDLRLVITVPGFDSSMPSKQLPLTVRHFFPVPPSSYNEKTWRRWVFEQCRRLENHELGEWFRLGDERPFSPLHGPGEDPYTVHEFRPEVDALTIQDGTMREPYKE